MGYTVNKLCEKVYTRFFQGPLKVNRKLSKKERKRQKNAVFPSQHCVSIVVPLYNTPEEFLRQMVASVQEQTYGNWQLCLADGSDEEHEYVREICEVYAKADARICYKKLAENRGISENTNACLDVATGDYIGLFDHDDLLHPSALYEVVSCIEKEQADFVYTDEATFLGKESRLLSVHRKPDFYMDNLRANNYICHFTVFRKTLLEITGGFRKEYDGSQDHDMIFRLCEQATKICHIPKVLYFWRAHAESVALHTGAKEYVVEAGKKAVEAHLERCGIPGTVTVLPVDMLMYDVSYEHEWEWCHHLAVAYEGEGMKEKLAGVEMPFVLVMRRGMQIPEPSSIQQMLMHMAKPEVAAVTPMVVGEEETICGTGARWSKMKKRYVPKYRYCRESNPGYMNELLVATGTPAVVNGCMLVRREFANMESIRAMQRGETTLQMVNEPRARVVFLAYKQAE